MKNATLREITEAFPIIAAMTRKYRPNTKEYVIVISRDCNMNFELIYLFSSIKFVPCLLKSLSISLCTEVMSFSDIEEGMRRAYEMKKFMTVIKSIYNNLIKKSLPGVR